MAERQIKTGALYLLRRRGDTRTKSSLLEILEECSGDQTVRRAFLDLAADPQEGDELRYYALTALGESIRPSDVWATAKLKQLHEEKVITRHSDFQELVLEALKVISQDETVVGRQAERLP